MLVEIKIDNATILLDVDGSDGDYLFQVMKAETFYNGEHEAMSAEETAEFLQGYRDEVIRQINKAVDDENFEDRAAYVH
jgi:hypothetical protein